MYGVPAQRARNVLAAAGPLTLRFLAVQFDFFCGDEHYVALTSIGDVAKRNFAEKHHII
jgi:hypothetical protein